MTRASITIMIAPTMARRTLTARSSTAERESPKSVTSTAGPAPRGKGFDAVADGVVLVRAHRAFAQPQHLTAVVVQGHGVRARGFDGCAHFLADGIEVDERTVRRTEGFAVLHRSAA